MSWKSSTASNNVHFDFPPIMNDSRNYSSFIPNIELDNVLKQQHNINNNSDYRKFLQNNATSIIASNFNNSLQNYNIKDLVTTSRSSGNPYVFGNITSRDQPYGYETSDLKEIYLSRQLLNSRIHAPRFNLEN